MSYTSVNPFNGELSQRFADINDAQLEENLATAQHCYLTWRQTSYVSRAIILNRAAVLMRERVDALAHTVTLETGKYIDEARGEVMFSPDILAYYAEHAADFLSPQVLHPQIGDTHMESSPIDIIFGIEPWNCPYYQSARVAGPHLMAGNVLVIKYAAAYRNARSRSKPCSWTRTRPRGSIPICSSHTSSLIEWWTTRESRAWRSPAALPQGAALQRVLVRTSNHHPWSWVAAMPSLCWRMPTWI